MLNSLIPSMFHRRITLVLAGFLLALVALGARVADLTLIEGDRLRAEAAALDAGATAEWELSHPWAGFAPEALDRYRAARERVEAAVAELELAVAERVRATVVETAEDPDTPALVARLEEAVAEARTAWAAAVATLGAPSGKAGA